MANTVGFHVNSARFKNRLDEYIVRMTSQSEEAVAVALARTLELAAATAPTPELEEQVVTSRGSPKDNKKTRRADVREQNRRRFFKGSGQFFIKEAIMMPGVWETFTLPSGRMGFRAGNVPVLDALTKWSWTNVQWVRSKGSHSGEQVTHTYEAPHGTYWFFEYGYDWNVIPKHGKVLNIAYSENAKATTKRIPAMRMFTNLSLREQILPEIMELFQQVEF